MPRTNRILIIVTNVGEYENVGYRTGLWLGELTNLPAQTGSERERLLTSAADTLQSHPALGAYKGEDEPRNPYRGKDWIRPDGLVRRHWGAALHVARRADPA